MFNDGKCLNKYMRRGKKDTLIKTVVVVVVVGGKNEVSTPHENF